MMVIGALCLAAARLANDPNGHHVLLYCLLQFDNDLNQVLSFCHIVILILLDAYLLFYSTWTNLSY